MVCFYISFEWLIIVDLVLEILVRFKIVGM